MLFYHEYENYIHTNMGFIRQPNTIVGSISTMRMFGLEIPSVSSATDWGMQILIKKIYSEYSERENIGIAMASCDDTIGWDFVKRTIERFAEKEVGYGESNRFGYVDTTGTGASVSNSRTVIAKAVSELIEKNELLLFWYLGKGEMVQIDDCVKSELKKYGLDCFENFFFKCQNLSNWSTIIHIACRNREVISTGICCCSNDMDAIKGAINETKTLRTLNLLRHRSSINCDKLTHETVYRYILELRKKQSPKESVKLRRIEYLDIEIADWIKNMQILFLGHGEKKGKVVTALSDSLIKCVPQKGNLKYCSEVEIYKRYQIGDVEEKVECIVL